MIERAPYAPTSAEWGACYEMLCGHCDHQLKCPIVEGMIEMKDGSAWPEGGWVTDPGAGVTCLSYRPQERPAMVRQQRRAIIRMPEARLPPVCGGCAARKGSEASVSLHTQRDYQAAVRSQAPFACHEDPAKERLCGGWCRAISQRAKRPSG